MVSDLLQAGNFSVLMVFHGLYEISCLHQRFMCSCIQPGKSLAQKFHVQLVLLQIDPVQIRDLQLSPCGRLQILGILHHLIVIEIKASDTVIGLWLCRFLFNGNRLALTVKLYDSKPLRIIHIITEHGSSFCTGCRCTQSLFQSVSVENIVTQDHGNTVISDKILTDDKCLCQSVRAWLYRIGQFNAKLMPISQKSLKPGSILRCGNDQYLSDSRLHKYGQRIIDHRFIIDR